MKKAGRLNDESVTACKAVIADSRQTHYPTISHTAGVLGIPVRTLQRRLHDEGLSYKKLIKNIRLEQACLLLQDANIPIAVVAKTLGYGDPGSFSRAFRRWKGMSPRAYRLREKNR
jgi:AraC-like DNA-binding protein